MVNLPSDRHYQAADMMVKYANAHGLWPTIDFIVERWVTRNPEEVEILKGAIADEKTMLQNRFGTNESGRKGNMPLRRVVEVPDKISNLINILFTVQKREYKGGEKQFWRDFAKRYPLFRIGD